MQRNIYIKKRRKKALMGMLFVLPSFVFIFAFMIYPLVYSFYISLSSYNFVYDIRPDLVGFRNYIAAFQDKTFLLTIKNTFVFSISFFVVVMVMGLLIALILFYYRGKSHFFRTCIFLPIVVPLSLAAILFSWIFAENFGLLNYFLGNVLNLPQLTYGWLTNRSTAMMVLVIVTVWSSVGFEAILFLAGLQSISSDILEAARIDGANIWRSVILIVLPNLRETYVITGIWAILRGLKVFVQPMVITSGGPGNATRVMYMHIYDNAFEYFEMGYAAALGFILSIIILSLSLLNLYMSTERESINGV